MFFNALVNFAIVAVGVLETLGIVSGLLFFVLSLIYLYENRNDGNLFWFVDNVRKKWNDVGEDTDND